MQEVRAWLYVLVSLGARGARRADQVSKGTRAGVERATMAMMICFETDGVSPAAYAGSDVARGCRSRFAMLARVPEKKTKRLRAIGVGDQTICRNPSHIGPVVSCVVRSGRSGRHLLRRRDRLCRGLAVDTSMIMSQCIYAKVGAAGLCGGFFLAVGPAHFSFAGDGRAVVGVGKLQHGECFAMPARSDCCLDNPVAAVRARLRGLPVDRGHRNAGNSSPLLDYAARPVIHFSPAWRGRGNRNGQTVARFQLI